MFVTFSLFILFKLLFLSLSEASFAWPVFVLPATVTPLSHSPTTLFFIPMTTFNSSFTVNYCPNTSTQCFDSFFVCSTAWECGTAWAADEDWSCCLLFSLGCILISWVHSSVCFDVCLRFVCSAHTGTLTQRQAESGQRPLLWCNWFLIEPLLRTCLIHHLVVVLFVQSTLFIAPSMQHNELEWTLRRLRPFWGALPGHFSLLVKWLTTGYIPIFLSFSSLIVPSRTYQQQQQQRKRANR